MIVRVLLVCVCVCVCVCCVAVCCSVVQCNVVCCNGLQMCRSVLQWIAVLQCVAVRYGRRAAATKEESVHSDELNFFLFFQT